MTVGIWGTYAPARRAGATPIRFVDASNVVIRTAHDGVAPRPRVEAATLVGVAERAACGVAPTRPGRVWVVNEFERIAFRRAVVPGDRLTVHANVVDTGRVRCDVSVRIFASPREIDARDHLVCHVLVGLVEIDGAVAAPIGLPSARAQGGPGRRDPSMDLADTVGPALDGSFFVGCI